MSSSTRSPAPPRSSVLPGYVSSSHSIRSASKRQGIGHPNVAKLVLDISLKLCYNRAIPIQEAMMTFPNVINSSAEPLIAFTLEELQELKRVAQFNLSVRHEPSPNTVPLPILPCHWQDYRTDFLQ